MVIITVLPQCMDNELKKAVHILKEFTACSSKGPDTLIPDSIFAKAKGVAVISYCKIGCFVSARGGSGIVVAKLPNGGWSAPSAVGIIGMSGGLEFGIEATAIIMMLMYSNAVKAFMKGKNVALGGGVSVAAGPLGRDLEVDVAVKSPAAMYTYAKAKGLFVGINLGGTLVLERKSANEKCYGPGVRAYDILSGRIEVPAQCNILHDVLRERAKVAKRKGIKQAVNITSKTVEKKYGVSGLNKFANKNTDAGLTGLDDIQHGSQVGSKQGKQSSSNNKGKTKFLSKKSSKSASAARMSSKSKLSVSKPSVKVNVSRAPPSRPTKKGPAPRPTKKRAPPRPPPKEGGMVQQSQSTTQQKVWGEALYPFIGQMSCDISFQKSEYIEILTRTQCEFDWWEGRIHGKVGIFPANYIRLVV